MTHILLTVAIYWLILGAAVRLCYGLPGWQRFAYGFVIGGLSGMVAPALARCLILYF